VKNPIIVVVVAVVVIVSASTVVTDGRVGVSDVEIGVAGGSANIRLLAVGGGHQGAHCQLPAPSRSHWARDCGSGRGPRPFRESDIIVYDKKLADGFCNTTYRHPMPVSNPYEMNLLLSARPSLVLHVYGMFKHSMSKSSPVTSIINPFVAKP
jgi:hypothetical protein